MKDMKPAQAVSHFRNVCVHAAEEQDRLLERLLTRNALTEFGELYGFGKISGYEQFRRTVPLSVFADYDQSFNRIIRGERNILTADPPVFYNISSGTTGESKYSPLCREDVEKQRLYVDEAIPEIIHELSF